MNDGGHQNDLSAEECIRAGMYWYGRSDLEAAESWWLKALEVEPENERAKECLELLQQTSATGFKSWSWASEEGPTGLPESPFVNPLAPEAGRRPYLEANPEISPPPPPSSDLSVGDEDGIVIEDEPVIVAPKPPPSREFQLSSPSVTTDPLEFASESARYVQPSEPAVPTPWDDGPAKTSVVTVETDDFDAVPDPTPLPEIDRDSYFDRYPRSREEIVEFLRATGDLPPDIGSNDVLDPDEPIAEEAREDSSDPLEVARNKFQLHDFDGVIVVLEGFDADHPAASEANGLIAEARAQLLKMYESKIGDFSRNPRVLVSGEEVIWLNLNHRAGFILSQIDGTVSYEDLIALSGMSRLDTVRILAELIAQKVIES